jgi:CheY-like chemotaxis protein
MAKKLLLADDSQTIQRVVDIVLGPEGFKVTSYGNGEDALKAVESVMPDVILADIEMPGLTGYQLCEKVKSAPNTHHIPVILLAGAFEPFDEDQMKSAGADDYILKPFESQELLSKVKSLLLQKEIVEVSVEGDAEAKPAVAEPEVKPVTFAEEQPAAAASKSEWYEQYSFPATEEPKEQIHVFEQELKESMKALETDIQGSAAGAMKVEKPSAPEAMSIEDISRMVKDAVGAAPGSQEYKFEAAAADMKSASGRQDFVTGDYSQNLAHSIRVVIEETIRVQIAAILPGILEKGMKEAFSELSGPLQGMINAEIKKVVPEVAERIIKQEIDKISAELA